MGKSVVWIDDKVNVMKEVVAYVFPSLWEKDVTSYIRITNKAEKSIEYLNKTIFDEFVSYIIDKGYIYDNEKVIHKEKLIKTSTESANQPTADIAVNISDLFEKYQSDISKIYKNEISNNAENVSFENEEKKDSTSSPSDCGENFASYLKEFTEELVRAFTDDTSFGIDLCLLDNDYDILTEKKDSPILSMVLYNILKQQQKSAFLYTTYCFPNNVIDGWISLYAHFFDSKCGKINVYNRHGQNVVTQTKDLNELIELIMGAKK